MPSPKTEGERSAASRWASFDPRSPTALLQRLNTRLVLALAIVALVGLVVSGIAITQILPGYFAEQTQERVQTTAASTGILLRQTIARRAEAQPNSVAAPEVRDQFVVPPVAEDAARIFLSLIHI